MGCTAPAPATRLGRGGTAVSGALRRAARRPGPFRTGGASLATVAGDNVSPLGPTHTFGSSGAATLWLWLEEPVLCGATRRRRPPQGPGSSETSTGLAWLLLLMCPQPQASFTYKLCNARLISRYSLCNPPTNLRWTGQQLCCLGRARWGNAGLTISHERGKQGPGAEW